MPFDDDLIARFVGCFTEPGEARAERCVTDAAFLSSLYAKLPARFPRLFERLLTEYRWPEVELDRLRLLPNPRGNGLDGFAAALFADKALTLVILKAGFIPFGRALDGRSYDPICFDTRCRRHGGDCPVVRLDHEAALIGHQAKTLSELAPTFRDLVSLIVEETPASSR